jgi:hypothetical protein
MTQTTGIIITKTMTIIKATNAIMTNNNMTVAIEKIDTTITLVTTRRTTIKCHTRIKITANAITSKKGTTRSWTTNTPFVKRGHFFWKKELLPFKVSFLVTLLFLLLLKQQQKELCKTTMSPTMIARQVAPSSTSIHILRTTTTDESTILKKAILFLPPLQLQKQRRTSVLPNRESCQLSNIFVSHLVSSFQIRTLIV